jgi:hypothetical protein
MQISIAENSMALKGQVIPVLQAFWLHPTVLDFKGKLVASVQASLKALRSWKREVSEKQLQICSCDQ